MGGGQGCGQACRDVAHPLHQQHGERLLVEAQEQVPEELPQLLARDGDSGARAGAVDLRASQSFAVAFLRSERSTESFERLDLL